MTQVIGQEYLQSQLLRAIQRGTIAHANLFWGSAGTGKLAMALWIAQTLNCSHTTPEGACLKCPSCQKIYHLIHPDVYWILPTYKNETEKKRTSEDFADEIRQFLLEHHFYPAYAQWVEKLDAHNKQTAINIEDIRQIKQKMSYAPFEGHYKIVILWHAEKMRPEAANAFLKLLEEPPQNTIFILTAPTPEQVLPTIQSRCQNAFFAPLNQKSIVNYLMHTHKTDESTAYKAAFLAQGNLNEALRLIHQDTHTFDDLVQNWLRACYSVKYKEMQEISEVLSKLNRETQKHFLTYLLHILRNALIAHYEAQTLLFVPDNIKEFTTKLGKTLSIESFNALYQTLSQAMEYVSRNVNSRILYLTLSIRISKIMSRQQKAP
ncbi:MAG: DNA polymerase III subunit delta' [Bacteroidia bacterium]|nr:DNA polymerase III subunit delta' [Bacteroidia bacterium]MDW8346818.1 DNA polymerase III subunit delta' [Bacteroidia bacterium]